jgi:hypothetical protein
MAKNDARLPVVQARRDIRAEGGDTARVLVSRREAPRDLARTGAAFATQNVDMVSPRAEGYDDAGVARVPTPPPGDPREKCSSRLSVTFYHARAGSLLDIFTSRP